MMSWIDKVEKNFEEIVGALAIEWLRYPSFSRQMPGH